MFLPQFIYGSVHDRKPVI